MGQLQLVKVSSVTLTQFVYICKPNEISGCEVNVVMLKISHTTVDAVTNPLPTTCPDLIAQTNGMIGYNMGTAGLRPVATVATYTCDTGYTLNGGTTRTCGSDGVWSGFAPSCQRKWNKLCTVCLYHLPYS